MSAAYTPQTDAFIAALPPVHLPQSIDVEQVRSVRELIIAFATFARELEGENAELRKLRAEHTDLLAANAKLRRELVLAREVLQECADYFEPRMDADLPAGENVYRPNREMRLYGQIVAAIAGHP